MSNVDDRVVSASFETSKFQQGVQVVLNGLERLKKALHFPNAGKGLDDVNAAAQRMNLSHIGNAIDQLKGRFTALRLVALQVLGNIVTQAAQAGARLVKSFTFGPVMDGLHEYETNLNSVQTILANTQASGAKLKDVNKALQDLNTYSDKTIYNFSQMAKNIGTFTAAGVDLKTATGSIKGIANLAALSGSNAEQASGAMYQLSQAISSGRVSLQDWNSVVNAGMGGTVFQRALAQTAEKMGTLSKGAVTLKGKMKNVSIEGQSFRESIQAGPGKNSWLTSDVLTKTLNQFTGDLSDAQLKAQGFNDAEIKAIQSQAKMALNAATQVKTLSGVLDTAKESAGSGWAQTWQIIFGDFGEAKTLFTGLSVAINGFISSSAAARNKVLGDWKKLGGRTLLISGIKDAFQALVSVVKPIKQAFRDIFPPTTGRDLLDLTRKFATFMKSLKIGPETAEGLRRTFRGLFAVLDIGKQVVGGIFTVIGKLFSSFGKGSGGFLKFTGSLGDNLVALDKWLKQGDRFHNFFESIGVALSKPLSILGKLTDAIAKFFSSFTGGGPEKTAQGLGDMTAKLTPMERLLTALSAGWQGFLDLLHKVATALNPVVKAIQDAMTSVGKALADAFSGTNFSNVMDALKVGLLGGIFLTIKNFFKKGLGGSLFGGLTESITGTFDALTGRMKAMQQNVQADTLMKIAFAIGILTASVVALSLINPDKLTNALSAMAIGFGQLLGSMAILMNISKSGGFLKIPFIAGAMILLATAIGILTLAVRNLSGLSWEELAKGLGGVGALLVAISIAARPLSKNSAGMIQAGIGIGAIAISMKILASAMKDFGGMSWTEIAKGLASVAGALAAIGLASKLFPAGMVQIGIGLIGVALGLKLLASAISTFGKMNWDTIGKGMISIAGALLIIAGAMTLMPPNMLATAAGLLLVSVALQGISAVVKSFGGMSVEAIAKGLITLAASLGILGLALYGMIGTLPGAAALTVAAVAVGLLAPALRSLGEQSWGQILKGLVALAAALTVLGVAATLLAPVEPALLGMGAALLLIGGGLALAGAGIALIGTGLSAIALAGPAAVLILLKALEGIVMAVPKFVLGVVMGLLTIVDKIAEVAPKFLKAFVTIISTAVDAVIQVTPKLAVALGVLITNAIKVLEENVPKMLAAGFKLVMALLTGVRSNIGKIVSMVADIVVKILSTLKSKAGALATGGAGVLTAFLKGIANNVRKVVTAASDIVVNFLKGIASNVGKIATAAGNLIGSFITGVGKYYQRVISAGAKMITGLLSGIGSKASEVVSKGVTIALKFVNSVGKSLVRLADEGAKAIVNFLNAIAGVIRRREPEIIAAGANIGAAVVSGFISGLGRIDIVGAIKRKFSGALSAAKSVLKSHSPSMAFAELGENVVQGFALGIKDNDEATKAVVSMSYDVINGVKDSFEIASPSKVMAQLGEFVTQGFAKGLLGSTDVITDSIHTLQGKLTDAMRTARDTISTEEDKLDRLRDAKKKDTKAIKEAQDLIKQNQDLLSRAKSAHTELTKGLKSEANELKGLSKQYKDVSDQLDEVTHTLEEAKKARDDAFAGFQSQYGELPEINIDPESKDPLHEFIQGLQDRTNAVSSYQATLEQLRTLGLDDKLYQKLLSEGTADQQFASQLLAGGQTAVASLNALDAQLQSVSTTLATQAAQHLYQAGVDSAQGLVNGLKSKQSELYKAMETLATAMIKAIKKKLKIKSPSEVFAEIGILSMQGMAQGIDNSAKLVTDSAVAAAEDAMEAMKKSVSSIVMSTLEVNPTITPVLDLSQVESDAKTLSSMLNVVPISAAASYNQASAISADQQNTVKTELDDAAVPAGVVQQFTQNNYSPSSLSEADIYRQTRNQLSQAKAVLP